MGTGTRHRRGGDSLMGRYFLYRMHPFTVGEVATPNLLTRWQHMRNQPRQSLGLTATPTPAANPVSAPNRDADTGAGERPASAPITEALESRG